MVVWGILRAKDVPLSYRGTTVVAWPYGGSVRCRCRLTTMRRSRRLPAPAARTYSGWLAAAARKEFLIRDGFAGVAEFEREHGAFTETELAEADAWADDAVRRSRRSGNRPRKSA